MQMLPPDARTKRPASFRVISDKLLTDFEQCEQKRILSVPDISSQLSEQGVFTSTESINLFFDIFTSCLPYRLAIAWHASVGDKHLCYCLIFGAIDGRLAFFICEGCVGAAVK